MTALPIQQQSGTCSLVFSPDGKILATTQLSRDVRLFDVTTGRQLSSLAIEDGYLDSIAFSADGKKLAATNIVEDLETGKDARKIVVWDLPSRRELSRFPVEPGRVTGITYSPDGRTIAVDGPSRQIGIRNAATGKEIHRIQLENHMAQCMSFSPDSKTLAFAYQGNGNQDCRIDLVEIATGRLRCRFKGHRGNVLCLAFTPNSKVLASGSMDTTILLWDLTGQIAEPTVRNKNLETLWADLAGPDAAVGFRAIQSLAAVPGESVPFLQARLHPVASLDPGQVSRWISNLDSNQFQVRKNATTELEKLAELAEPALRESLRGKPSAETRRQVLQLLEQLANWTPERLRVLRAIEVLERIDSAEAQAVLRGQANGAPKARLTQEAKMSLERLEKGVAKTP
jgi:hypothetical protein